MKIGLRLAITAVGLASMFDVANADTPYNPVFNHNYTYFNKPNSDIASMDSNINYCAAIVQNLPWAQVSGAAGGALIGSVFNNINNNAFARANIENCMVWRGWRVVAVTREEGEQLASLQPNQLTDRLASWVGETDPHGSIVRSFTNVLMKEPNSLNAIWPYMVSLSLSEDRFNWNSLPKSSPSEAQSLSQPRFLNPTRPDQLGLPGDGKAILIARLTWDGGKFGHFIYLSRRPSAPGNPDGGSREKADAIWVRASTSNPAGELIAFVVPSGTWYISGSFGSGTCFEDPYLQASSGQVLFLGSFAFSDRISFSPGAMPGGSAIPPSIAAAMTPASWKNELRYTCGIGYLNPLHFPEMSGGTPSDHP
jgi:hypothetical protein